jgi:general nucleoside transport system permease protein
MSELLSIVLTIMTAATPILLAATGELVTERSGVLNLGVEGMMSIGAVLAFAAAFTTGSPYIGILAAVVGGMLLSLVFAFLTLVMVSNQVATGLALTLLGLGLSALIGESFVGQPGIKLEQISVPVLSEIPVLGPIVFRQDLLVYFSLFLSAATSYVLTRTRIGLVIRAVGDNHASAHALGFPVNLVRLGCILFGGACAGLGGGYLSLAYTPLWIENMTAGRGWIALALVVFGSWMPNRAALGAYLFGTVMILGFALQSKGSGIPSQFLSSLPYLVTIGALVLLSGKRSANKTNAPACLGQSFMPDK